MWSWVWVMGTWEVSDECEHDIAIAHCDPSGHKMTHIFDTGLLVVVAAVVVQVVTVAVMTKPADIGPRPPGVRRRQSLCLHCFHRW